MNSLESLVAAWAARGWLALLAFTAAVLLVAVLRKPCRRWFGAERAFQLWLLPPLALLASQMPHAAAAPAPLPPLVYTITSVVGAAASRADDPGSFDWRIVALLLWLAGLAAVLVFAVVAQCRYRERLYGATPMVAASVSRPVLRAARADIGPALVGAWRSRIVLPADFRERYDATEQALILAHEAAHARRGDGWWCLLAQMLVALLWCHPLAWWALAALRHDQELACDAAVLRGHGAQRRSYANAMLKTQSAAFALPVGCAWSPRHPLTERIEMLRRPMPGKLRDLVGRMLGVAIVVGCPVAVYAAQPSAHAYQSTREAVQEALVLSNSAKMAVKDYVFHHNGQMPADNDAVKLPAAVALSGKFVRRIEVADGVVTAVLRAKPGAEATAGSVRWVPHVNHGDNSVAWACQSPNIPTIAGLDADCVYAAGIAASRSEGGMEADRYTLKLDIALDGKPADRHMTLCLKPGEYANVSELSKNAPPLKGRIAVLPVAKGQIEVRGDFSGGSLDKAVSPIVRILPGKPASIMIGRSTDQHGDWYKSGHWTGIKLDMTTSIGC